VPEAFWPKFLGREDVPDDFIDVAPMSSRVRALYRIEAGPDGPAKARGVVRRECSERVPRRTLEKLLLLVSELVTNGIAHGRGNRDDSITLDLRLNSTLRFAVVDHGEGFATRAARERGGGWGLGIVERLADRWGVQRTREETRVWFETAAPTARPTRRRPG
jgi:two-component sensor histidine kinase